MVDLSGFDASAVEPMEDRGGALPPGEYLMAIAKTDRRETKSGTGAFVEIEFEVIDGPMKGKRAWKRLNLWNQSAQTVQIAQSELSTICRAAGRLKPKLSEELHGIPMIVRIGRRKDNPEQTEPKGYGSASGRPPAAQTRAEPAYPPSVTGATIGAKTGPWAS